MKIIHSYFLFAIILSVFLFNSCKDKPTESSPLETKISGKITNKDDNTPINGAQITTSPTTSAVSSDASGQYTISDVKPGEYTVSVTKSGFKPATINVGVTEGKTASADIQLEVVKAQLASSVNSIDFGTTQSTTTFTLSNSTGVGSITWTAATSANWLSVSPSNGTISTGSATITINGNRSTLAYGNYLTTITLTSNAGNIDIPVTLAVANPNAPQLTVSPLLLDFNEAQQTMSFTIRNSGTGKLSWNANSSQSWISISPTSDSTKTEIDQIDVTVNRVGLPSADYTGEITVTSNAGSQTVTVKMSIPSVPLLSISTTTLDFDSVKTQLSFNVNNAGAGSLNWAASGNQSWMSVGPTSGTNSGTVNVTVSRTSLSPGNYSGSISLTSNGGNGAVSISMRVVPPSPPQAVTAQGGTITTSSVQIQWSVYPNTSDFAAYKIYYSTSPAVTESSTLATTITDRSTQSYTITGLSSNTTYYVKVFVLSTNSQSSGSNTVSATTVATLGSWSLVTTLPAYDLSGISFIAENDIWVSGSGESQMYGLIWHYNGSKWNRSSIDDSSVTASFSGISFISSSTGWVTTRAGGKIYKYNGIAWALDYTSSLSGGSYADIVAIDQNTVWATGTSGMNLWNGSAWSTSSLNASSINDICYVSKTEGYAVDIQSKVFRYNGVGWSLFGQPYSSGGYIAKAGVSAINSSDIWVVHSSHAYHFNGTSWQQYYTDANGTNLLPLYSINLVASNNGWAVGYGGAIYHWDGSKWTKVNSPTSNDLYRIKMTSATDGWAVGANGVVLRYH